VNTEALLSELQSLEAGHIESWVARLCMGGPLPPGTVAAICAALRERGAGQHVGRMLQLCDLQALTSVDALRLRTLARAVETDAGRPKLRVWVTGAVTLDALATGLEAALLCRGYLPEVKLGGFGQLHMDLRDAEGPAARFQPDFVVVGYDVAGLAPELVQARRNLSDPAGSIRAGVGRLADSLTEWRRHSNAGVVLHTVTSDSLWRVGFHDYRHPGGAAATQAAINRALAELCGEISGVYLIDVAELAGQMGARFRDERRRLYGRYPASADAMTAWGVLAADCIHVVRHGPRKVVVCDLDDTMWGGICGEVGPANVQVGPEFPGNAYLEFQRALLDLKSQGILLALCSKNDPETALEVFRSCGRMALRLDDVAAYRIGWQPKPRLIAELAEELNLGLSSFVFLDDSPQERAAVRQALPEVLVPELPADVVERPAFVRSLRELWPVTLTESDWNRAQVYQAQRERERLRSGSASLADFLRSLGQVLTVGPVREDGFARVAQMHQRTNQFNMTTRRYDEAALRRMCAEGAALFAGSVRDVFGDQGVTVAALVIPEGAKWRIDTFLMSCRVMGRQVETAFMGYIVEQARRQGVRTIEGEFIPSERNKPAAEVYARLGFAGPFPMPGGGQRWELDVETAVLPDVPVEVSEM